MNKLFKLGLIAGGVALVSQLMARKKSDWTGLSEAEVREKLDARIPRKVPEDKRSAISDDVVDKMRSKGMLREDETTPVTSEVGEDEASDASAPENGDETKDSTDSA